MTFAQRMVAIRVASILLGIAAIAAGLYRWDAWPYVEARQRFESEGNIAAMQVLLRASGDDAIALRECDAVQAVDFAYRSCLLQRLAAVQSAVGVADAAALANHWLHEHAADVDVRDAAQIALDRGRVALEKEKPVDELMDRMNATHDASRLYRYLDGPAVHQSRISRTTERFDAVQAYLTMLGASRVAHSAPASSGPLPIAPGPTP